MIRDVHTAGSEQVPQTAILWLQGGGDYKAGTIGLIF